MRALSLGSLGIFRTWKRLKKSIHCAHYAVLTQCINVRRLFDYKSACKRAGGAYWDESIEIRARDPCAQPAKLHVMNSKDLDLKSQYRFLEIRSKDLPNKIAYQDFPIWILSRERRDRKPRELKVAFALDGDVASQCKTDAYRQRARSPFLQDV